MRESGHLPSFLCISFRFLSRCILLSIEPINTKLKNVVKLDMLFSFEYVSCIDWRNSQELVPRLSRYKARQWPENSDEMKHQQQTAVPFFVLQLFSFSFTQGYTKLTQRNRMNGKKVLGGTLLVKLVLFVRAFIGDSNLHQLPLPTNYSELS